MLLELLDLALFLGKQPVHLDAMAEVRGDRSEGVREAQAGVPEADLLGTRPGLESFDHGAKGDAHARLPDADRAALVESQCGVHRAGNVGADERI